ncbi:MAG TPA: DUF883 family protein [Aromatoleum sp.]|uniref:DUF883 family protein n=1 Tax=Aromatoleum sp. TaxID=2307007 RepID=UPI002B494060|nr:DUF883 family protein [Aromatoleum sp.]HJV24891.1 DUF883 family protein [Aromatoleum sp.]
MPNATEVSREKLVADLKVMISDADELLRLTAGQAGEKVTEVRARLGERLTSARSRVGELETSVVEQTKKVANATDDYVHKNPWQSLGVAAGVAFLLGLLAGRR